MGRNHLVKRKIHNRTRALHSCRLIFVNEWTQGNEHSLSRKNSSSSVVWLVIDPAFDVVAVKTNFWNLNHFRVSLTRSQHDWNSQSKWLVVFVLIFFQELQKCAKGFAGNELQLDEYFCALCECSSIMLPCYSFHRILLLLRECMVPPSGNSVLFCPCARAT